MGEANQGGSRGMEKVSLQTEKYPTDLLQRFLCSNSHQTQIGRAFNEEEEEDTEEIELNLGLSLGGRFGVDKNSKKLIRSSSIAGTMLLRDDDASTPAAVSYPAAIIRTSSLPPETEEEWRKRKELQTLRRMEAKRRRFEKQRNKDGIGIGMGTSGCFEEERREIEGLTGLNLREKRHGSGISTTVAPPFGLPTWAAAARQALTGGIMDEISKGKGGCTSGGGGGTNGGGFPGVGQPASQCSAESQGGSSSGMSELDSKQIQGSSSYGEARSSSQERGNLEAAGSSGSKMCENPSASSKTETKNQSKKPDSGENKGREAATMSMEDMPCVFTIGDGPDGRRVEGILYKYGKGEEVRIMCVCHGKFLSPAEFVKHAGGKNVAHPLRHIVVNPNSGPFL
ncbi:ninja-family protein AFP3-like [Cucumis melo var. makuwa]|uniref:Ninja-family protein n=2 Tax=Cucumis melo TaxID=3656 RepID=A0A5D3CCX0_CUCMM|nr:ninja-family protein AFP3-like [Cucumis melo]KAA0034475.1 ninja-family protein AFP3-like [Cucumis melo var. makuwa]TYK09028.1 ninja-family protein AFP3-like [Cucumis melo var. makuwa]